VPDVIPDHPDIEEMEEGKGKKEEPKRELRGGTGTAGPLFQLPGQEGETPAE
jgi:hypothetical protein